MEKMTPFQFTKKFVVAAIAIWIAAAILAGQTVQADDYDDFNDFCVDNYGAELEELVYEMFGQDLQVKPAGDWTHISEKSAVICWETNLPAKTKVEYGTTTSYGESTEVEGRHFYIHVHYLTDCDPNTLYHYKLVSTDACPRRFGWLDSLYP